MGLVLWWLCLALIPGFIASSKDRSFFGFFLLSVVLSPLVGLICALVAGSGKPIQVTVSNQASGTNESRVPCPLCQEQIMPGAKICKHCGSSLEAVMPPTPTDDEIMATHGIRKDGRIYHYKEWRYDNLAEAVQQAKSTSA